MTPHTRTSNRDTDFKVYYSNKAPQQVYFPHESKTVRRRSTPVRDGQEKRQMVFLPDKMRRQRTEVVRDSDEDRDELDAAMEDVEEEITIKSKQKGRKRNSDIMHEERDSEHDDSIPSTSKRHCKTVPPKSHRRTRRIQATSDNEPDDANSTDRERTLRRQSTMTQLVDGRKPLPGGEEPEFKPVKKTPRLSWGGRGKTDKRGKDQKQRTLTQMVPGMRPPEIMSEDDMGEALSDVEVQDRDDQAYGDAVAQRLARQGLYQTGDNDGDSLAVVKAEGDVKSSSLKKEGSSMTDSQGVLPSVEDDGDDSYKPTQFIDAPVKRSDRVTRRNAKGKGSNLEQASHVPQESKKSGKARFSLLSTPEKRRIREIPSSQSPADSPASTQVTPHRLNRSPLKQCMANSSNTVAETPSKRKQVTFRMPSKNPVPPPKLRRFESTIQDSEDEDDDIIEEDALLFGRATRGVDANMGVAIQGKSIGQDTQRMLDQIDQTCAEAPQAGDTVGSGSSSESDSLPVIRGHDGPSPQLGEFLEHSPGQQSVRYDEPTRVKQEPKAKDYDGDDSAELPAQVDQLRSTPPVLEADLQETLSSTAMVIKDEPIDEETPLDRDLAPSHSSRRTLPQPVPTGIQRFTDLDGESIQVPRSPSPKHESQQSHSSKAEQQLHDEWLSYSQYANVRPPGSSSVRVAPDAFSYDATPRPAPNPAPPAQQQPQSSGYRPSQATTVDETTQRTPGTKRTQHFSSTHTTPHRIASSQPVFHSPSKPPSLFIPSSFPSPEKTGAHPEGWSSPVLGTTQDAAPENCRSSQWASLEDFSIPLPPPPALWLGDGDEDEDEDDEG